MRYSLAGFAAVGGFWGLTALIAHIMAAAPVIQTYLFLLPGLLIFGGMLVGAYCLVRYWTAGVPLMFSVILPQLVGWQSLLATWLVSSPCALVVRNREGMWDLASVVGVEYQVAFGEHVGLWVVRINLLAGLALGLLFALGVQEQHTFRARSERSGGV